MTAAEDELAGIAEALGFAGKGVLQVVSDVTDPAAGTQLLRRLVQRSGRLLSVSLAQAGTSGRWRQLLDWVDATAADSLPLRAQVAGRPVGLMLGLDATLHPFVGHPSWQQIAARPLADKLSAWLDPQYRARILAEEPVGGHFASRVLQQLDRMFLLGDPPDGEQPPKQSLAPGPGGSISAPSATPASPPTSSPTGPETAPAASGSRWRRWCAGTPTTPPPPSGCTIGGCSPPATDPT